MRQFKILNKEARLVVPDTITLRKELKHLLVDEGVQGYREVDLEGG